MEPFANEPVLELRRAPVRESLADALKAHDERPGIEVPVWIGDDRRHGDELISTDPGDPARVVARAARATENEVAEAVATAATAARAWAATPATRRAEILSFAASLLRERRLALAALALRECAKPWPEADADICEAIDFLEYYAREAVALADSPPPLISLPGEQNSLHYHPRGVAAVISPWNFPVAIPCGMVAAALATGNTVVLKPAEQAPGCAIELVRVLREAGVPPGALALLPGLGDVGAALVRDPRVHVIAFTGSGAVGKEIISTAAQFPAGQHHVKSVVAEMGGKNCVIVDGDADLDEVVPALIRSAFLYAGQKCSAASRVLCHEAIADGLLERLGGAVEVLQVGQASDLATEVPPVIEAEAQARVRRYAHHARSEGRIIGRPPAIPDRGWFCSPTIAADLPPGSPVLEEEIFGPVLAIERVRSVEDACDRIDASPYALTGGLFARNPDTVDRVIARSPVGNLYINRAITGAMVARQPFGGNRLSGTGTKAGGPNYLLHFVEPRVVTENTMRHGLVVE